MTRLFPFLLLLCLDLVGGAVSLAAGQAEHVVVLVWDGMRPDFVTPQYTPTLYELATRGTFFKNHHSAYVTTTEVNGTALVTGMQPARSGIFANSQYHRELNWLGPLGTEAFDAVRRGDLLWDGHYLDAATIPEVLQSAGFPTITAGAKPVVLLHDRASKKATQAQKDSVTLFRGKTLPRSLMDSLVKTPEIGAFPADPPAPDSTKAKITHYLKVGRAKALEWIYGKPKTPQQSRLVDAWTTKALVHGLWKDGVPKYTLLWLSEPDASQHESGVGSGNAELGLASSDKNLALVLKTLETKGVLDKTDILIVSDHGFSTIDRGSDQLIDSLKRARFVAGKQFDNPEAGDVLVVHLGGSTCFYVYEHDEATIRRLVEYLQCTDYAGVIFTALRLQGTFPLSQVGLEMERGGPDVLVAMRWSKQGNDLGAPGIIVSPDGKRGRGTHGSLSRFDINNTLIAAGPDFKTGYVSELASGNIDIAPTVYAILGVHPPAPTDGRVLVEAMTGHDQPIPKMEEKKMEASRDFPFRTWHQYLKFSRVGPVTYYDEGNGESRVK
ncbi:MAG: alkaline phosphatase family protein [Verrucomicrobiota bacterium]